MAPTIIHFDYDFSPVGQKTKLLLRAAGIPFAKCDQPAMLPRKDLEALGITYRRIPLLALGKDIYCDSAHIIATVLTKLDGGRRLATGAADAAFQEWGNTVFNEVLGFVPPQVLTPEFVRDRETVFPILKRPDLESMRPSVLAQFRARLRHVEDVFLAGGGPFINGEKISVADVHVVWPLRWALMDLGAKGDVGTGKEAFPKVWRMIESLPQAAPEVLSAEETLKTIRGAEYTAEGPVGVAEDDAYGLKAGTTVCVESFDSTPGAHPQMGKLVGTTIDEVVIEVDDGIRLHFPRIGYIVRSQADAPKL